MAIFGTILKSLSPFLENTMNKDDFMLCQSTTEPEALQLNPELWKAQFKFDGERIIAVVDKGSVLLLNRRGNIKNNQFREIVEQLSSLPDCILDGEIISKDNNFNKLQSRAATQNIAKIRMLEKSVPVDYMVFDILSLEGKLLTRDALRNRLDTLTEALGRKNLSNIKICTLGEIKAMLDYAKSINGEGIIIKNLDSIYEGKRSWNWLKLKLWKETMISITTYQANNAGIRCEDNVGNAVQISGSQHGEVKQLLDEGKRVNIYVQYLEKTKEGKMRFPSYRGIAEGELQNNGI